MAISPAVQQLYTDTSDVQSVILTIDSGSSVIEQRITEVGQRALSPREEIPNINRFVKIRNWIVIGTLFSAPMWVTGVSVWIRSDNQESEKNGQFLTLMGGVIGVTISTLGCCCESIIKNSENF